MSGRPARAWRGRALALLLGPIGCADETGPTLADASTEVQYESVASLGPHRMTATTRRTELRDGAPTTDVQEAMEITWQSWDAFEMRRLVDGEQVSLVRVADGRAWAQRGDGSWVARGDPEPWRQELRIAWSAWDQALEPFDDRVTLTEVGDDVVEGRRARRYTVSLAPPSTPTRRAGRAKAKGKPGRKARRRRAAEAADPLLDLSGEVVLDAGTATRLLARIEGRWTQDDRIRTVALDLRRSGIGQPQTLLSPEPDRPRRAASPDAATPPEPQGAP